jgi:predicted nucleic acid-binding protein
MKLLLDTSVIIDYTKGDARVLDAVNNADGAYTSALCSFETLVGSLKSKDIEGFLVELTPLPFTFRDSKRASNIYSVLFKLGRKVNLMDVLIYAQAAERGMCILTNDSDFGIINDAVNGGLEIVKP